MQPGADGEEQAHGGAPPTPAYPQGAVNQGRCRTWTSELRFFPSCSKYSSSQSPHQREPGLGTLSSRWGLSVLEEVGGVPCASLSSPSTASSLPSAVCRATVPGGRPGPACASSPDPVGRGDTRLLRRWQASLEIATKSLVGTLPAPASCVLALTQEGRSLLGGPLPWAGPTPAQSPQAV